MDLTILHDCFDALQRAPTAEAAFPPIAAAAAALGFRYCVYGLRRTLPLARPDLQIVGNHPREWEHRYVKFGYVTIDPIIKRVAKYHQYREEPPAGPVIAIDVDTWRAWP